MEDYINKFHTLSGTTISEHQKNFNIYMQQVKNSGININTFLEELQPQHPQQQIFYTRLLIEFGHREKILSALTSGNKLIIKTVLNKADLKALFDDVTPKQFVEEVCMKLSPLTRIKLMNRIGKSDYFQYAVAAYGISDCKALLVDCEKEVLKGYIVETKVRFTDRELIKIFQKHSIECLELYFERRKNISFSNCNKLAYYLISQHAKDFVQLLKFGYPKLGRRCLKKLIASNLVDIKELNMKLEKAKLEHRKLDMFMDWKNLNMKYNFLYYSIPLQEYVDVFRKSLPDDVDKFLDNSHTIVDFLKKIHKTERGNILFEIFKAKYGFEMYSSLNYINAQIMELLPLEDRLKFKLDNGYEEMMGVDKSIPLLKGKINATTSSYERTPLLNKLVDTCKVNDDLTALKELLKYFNKRHRNEERYTRDSFLYKILYSFKHERLDEETWKLISEAIDVFTVNNEFCDGIFLFLETEIYNKYHKGEDYTKELKRFIKDTGCYISWNLLQKHPEIEKTCIIKSQEFIGDLFANDDQMYAYLEFFNTISDYNKRHHNEKISFLQFPRVLKIILNLKWNSWYYQGRILQKSLQFVPQNDAEKQIQEEILEVFEIDCKHITEELSLWLLKNRPDYLLGKAKHFFHEDVCKPNFLRKVARNYSLKLYEDFIESALEIIANPNENEKELNGAFLFLSSIPNYCEMLDNFLRATEDPLRLRNLLTKLKFNDVPEKKLMIVSYFIKSKYSGLVTACLNNTLYNSREELLIGFVNTCEDHQVFALVTSLINSEIGLEIIIRDGNYTKFLFKCLYRISIKNQKAWELVLKYLDFQKIPSVPKLTHLYDDRVPILLDKIFKFELDMDTTYALLKQLKPEQIDSNLLDMILTIYSKREAEDINASDYKLKDFIYKIFLYNPKLLERVEIGFKHLIPGIAKFLCIKSLEETELKMLTLTMIELLITQTNCNFTTSLFTKLTAHYLQNSFNNLEQLLITQLQNAVELYGNGIKFIYRSTVKSFLKSLPGISDDELWNLSEKLVQAVRDESTLCLALDILPDKLPKNEVLLHKSYSMIELIESTKFPIIGVFLNQCMKGLA